LAAAGEAQPGRRRREATGLQGEVPARESDRKTGARKTPTVRGAGGLRASLLSSPRFTLAGQENSCAWAKGP
jgi:hypothetical protein